MKYVLDASIAVAAMKPAEPLYAASRARVDGVLAGTDEIIVPALFSVEVAAALARTGVVALDKIGRYVDVLLAVAEVVTIGPVAARRIGRVAMRLRLRAADASYVWLAEREGVSLVTGDGEVLSRASAVAVTP